MIEVEKMTRRNDRKMQALNGLKFSALMTGFVMLVSLLTVSSHALASSQGVH